MLPGGIADKLGNRYEAKWLVRCFLDLVADKAPWLKFESPLTDYQGFEFAIQRGETTEWHQTKLNAPKGNWTLSALAKEGVLKAFKSRLSSCENAHCFFVSQDNAKTLRALSEKARETNNFSEFIAVLAKDELDPFLQLISEWACLQEEGFVWLRRSYVKFFPESEIDSLIESFGDLYFQVNGNAVFPALRDILEARFNKRITPEIAREAIKSQGILTIKEWSLDPTISTKLCEETEAYLQTYSPFGAGGEIIPRQQACEVIDEVLNHNGASLILLTGVAGSGKSGVVRAVVEKLGELAISHLAFRVDHFLTCTTREELGAKLTGLQESPVSTLKGISPTKTAVLIIDQVDAVSEVSGRNGQVKESIFRMIEDAKNFGGVRVIVACRTFDFENDPRLKLLKEANLTKQIEIPLLSWDNDVFLLLKTKGIKVSGFSGVQRNLLCFPINLAVFLEIGEDEFNFQSRSALYEKLIEKKQRKLVTERSPGWALMEPLVEICEWMSVRQKLNAPATILDIFPGAIDALNSEGLIVTSRGQVNFFHESFFDYVYARGFLNNSQSLIDLLLSTEQHLFRRTQIRQIFEALRQGDHQSYLDEIKAILSSDQVRFHIKVAVSQWLNSIELPTSQEFEIITAFDNPMIPFNQIIRNSLLSTHTWFDILREKGWIADHLNEEHLQRRENILWWLSRIAGERPDEIGILLREWWGNIPARAEKLINWFGYIKRKKADRALWELCKDIIKSHPTNIFSGTADSAFGMLLYTLGEKNCEFNWEVLHSLFDTWFEMNPGRNLLGHDGLKDMDTYYFTDLAKKTPQDFLKGTTDTLRRSIDLVIAEGPSGPNWYHFNCRNYSGHRFGFDEFLGVYRSALLDVVRSNPNKAIEHLEKLGFNKHECLMHLHLEAIRGNPQALGTRLVDLVSNPLVFEAGWKGADWLSFANAAREALPHLPQQDQMKVEDAILTHKPEVKWAREILSRMAAGEESQVFRSYSSKDIIQILNRSGYEEWCILETIGEANLSEMTRGRLGELRRKFPDGSVEQPSHGEAQFLGSPIKSSHCEHMKDKHWLSAIAQYDEGNFVQKQGDLLVGGPDQLARELQQAAKNNPKRFSTLTLSIPLNAHISYIQSILWGLAESDEPNETCLAQAIRQAHLHPDKAFGTDIARLIESHPKVARDVEILDILVWYAEHGEATLDDVVDERNTLEGRIHISNLLTVGPSFEARGRNGAKGLAWEALGSVLWEVPNAKERVWVVLEHALPHEELISIRCCMIKPLIPLFNDDKNRFTRVVRSLIVPPEGSRNAHLPIRLSPLVTQDGVNLFPFIFYWLPALGVELVSALLNCGEKNMELVGAWLVFRESYRNDKYTELADTLVKMSIDHRRLAAKVSADAMKWAENKNRAEKLVKEFFFDEDQQVRKQAADVFRDVPPNEVEGYLAIAADFLRSPALADNGFAILRMLSNSTCDVLELVIEAARHIIEDIAEKGDQHGQRSLELHQLQALLSREYVSSEGRLELRKKILDLIDLMVQHELYGVEQILTAHER